VPRKESANVCAFAIVLVKVGQEMLGTRWQWPTIDISQQKSVKANQSPASHNKIAGWLVVSILYLPL